MFIGLPKAREAVLHLPNCKKLQIVSKVKNGIINQVFFNDVLINDYKLSLKDSLSGGKLLYN